MIRSDFTSPYINRFLQPDTIIPSPANPQAFNRFGYVGNNPVNFSDPSGHYPTNCGPDNIYCGGLAENNYYHQPAIGGGNNGDGPCLRNCGGDEDQDGFPEEPDPTFPSVNIPESHIGCDESTYVECFYARELFDIDGIMMIDEEEFNQFILALFYDIYGRSLRITPFTHTAYDTPFYDASGDAPGMVCFQGTKCYGRSEVNYIAQGMLASAEGLSEDGGKRAYIYPWKLANYLIRIPFPDIPGDYSSPTPSEGTIYWYEYGYNTYSVLYNSVDPLGIQSHGGR